MIQVELARKVDCKDPKEVEEYAAIMSQQGEGCFPLIVLFMKLFGDSNPVSDKRETPIDSKTSNC